MSVNLSSPPAFTRCKCGEDLLSSAEVNRSNSWIESTFSAVKYSQARSRGQKLSKSSLELLPQDYYIQYWITRMTNAGSLSAYAAAVRVQIHHTRPYGESRLLIVSLTPRFYGSHGLRSMPGLIIA